MEIVGEAADGREALEMAQRLTPDLVLMDLAMPELSGLEALDEIIASGVQTRVLMLTIHDEEEYLYRVIRSGGAGYVVKSSADRDLLEAIRTVHQGGVFLQTTAVTAVLKDYSERAELGEIESSVHQLSDRERQVLKLSVEGFSNQEIADKLGLSAKTIDTYRGRIMDKLRLRHRSELVRYALRRGLLEPEP